MRSQLIRRAGLALAAVALGAAALQASHAPAARAAATTPSVVAVSRLQDLIDTIRSQPQAYAGLWIDDKTGTVYVSATSASVTPADVAGIEPAAAQGTATMPLEVVHAKYDFTQLAGLAARVTSDATLRKAATASHAVMSEWYPDPVTDKVVIGFTKVTAAERAAVQARYGATARVIAAPGGTMAIGMGRGTDLHPSSRSADSAPWYGGDLITFTRSGKSYFCTSGYEFGSSSMSTAGHCGADPTSFYNNGVFYGKTYSMQYGNNRIDMQLMNQSSYLPYIWAGPGGGTPELVSGSGGVAQGARYCTDGVTSGENCSAIVKAIDVCVTLSNDQTGGSAYECDQDQATSNNGTCIFQGGDSGGPVFNAGSTTDPFANGTVTGESNSGCTSGWWSDMYEEKVIFGTSPAT